MIIPIPLQSLPNQQLSTVLDGQECQITLRQIGTRLYGTLAVDGETVYENAICHHAMSIKAYPTSAFKGTLFFLDTYEQEAPQWEGLGTRWMLYYASEDEQIYQDMMNV